MDQQSDLDHMRERPALYIGDTTARGLHHLLAELMDNVIDQYLSNNASLLRVGWHDNKLTVSDDGVGLPFDVAHEIDGTLATHYLSQLRIGSPTADGHTPHVHLGGWGCGLRVVTALTSSCTEIEIVADSNIFQTISWNTDHIEKTLDTAAHLFPGLRIKSPTVTYETQRGLAEWCETQAGQKDEWQGEPSFWMEGRFGDLLIQMGAAGSAETTEHIAYANANYSQEGGTHLTALKRAVSACSWTPSFAAVHVIMNSPRFAGPTKTKLDTEELFNPIYQAIAPALRAFADRRDDV